MTMSNSGESAAADIVAGSGGDGVHEGVKNIFKYAATSYAKKLLGMSD